MAVTVSQILIYPVKGLDAHHVSSSVITKGGSLKFDRMLAMKSDNGKYINGKKSEKIHHLRSKYDLDNATIALWHGEYSSESFSMVGNLLPLQNYLSDFFEQNVTLHYNDENGFPDDSIAYGPTVSLYESYMKIAEWFPGLTPAELIRRFRCNIILNNSEPFWEDNLLPENEGEKSFRLGEVQFYGTNACARCIVPSKDPVTGNIYPLFQKSFTELRRESLPAWAPKGAFDHFYRFTVNTKIPLTEAGKTISVGDTCLIAES